MRRREDGVVIVLSLFAAFLMMNFLSIHYFDSPLLPSSITGRAVDSGSVNLSVFGQSRVITIHYPLNSTYDFNIGDTYLFDLNVSADFVVSNWTYSLYDHHYNVPIETNTDFTPNSSFVAVRWENNLTVSALDSEGTWYSESVFFYVNVSNSAPILGLINDQIHFCEGNQADYRFNATDADEDELQYSAVQDGPYIFMQPIGTYERNVTLYALRSPVLGSSAIGSYEMNISVTDEYNATCCADTFTTNVTVIEINDDPSASPIGTQTVYWVGENSTFNYSWPVTDDEDGDAADGNMTFNRSWEFTEDFFDINSTTGVMNYAYGGESEGDYTIEVCVTDNPLLNPHPNITGACGETGAANTYCDTFNFIITFDNRPPVIDSYIPLDTNFSVEGTTSTDFIVNVSDPDMPNTSPDIDWYLDDVLVRQTVNQPTDTFSHSFGCGVSGLRNVTAVTTDGLENDSQNWEVTVLLVACPASTTGSGGGGGGGSSLFGICNEEWVCNNFDVCQNVDRSLDSRAISPEFHSDSKEICAQRGFEDPECGFQITACFDLSDCNNPIPRVAKPVETRSCYYTENPSCYDGISNCHDGSCELLVDCGGSCSACSTCSDGIQNQGEGNVDCGGPCPFICPVESPYSTTSYLIIILGILAIIILLFILYIVFKIIRYRFQDKRAKHLQRHSKSSKLKK